MPNFRPYNAEETPKTSPQNAEENLFLPPLAVNTKRP
jgi:hypothetical protein